MLVRFRKFEFMTARRFVGVLRFIGFGLSETPEGVIDDSFNLIDLVIC
jgi:hypothetical protein